MSVETALDRKVAATFPTAVAWLLDSAKPEFYCQSYRLTQTEDGGVVTTLTQPFLLHTLRLTQ